MSPAGSAAVPTSAAAEDDVAAALTRAGRLLATRARAQKEIRDRLAAAGFSPEVVASALTRLSELGLVDDAAFARQWVAERSATKRRSPKALLWELRTKGVERSVAEEALAEVGVDEIGQAIGVATRAQPKWAGLPLSSQAQKLWGTLGRRGFSPEACEGAIKAVLPPEGWD